MRPKRRVVIGLVGTNLDRGTGPGRWEQWRPTVALCQHEDLLIDRLELLHEKKAERTADVVLEDAASVSPETSAAKHLIAWTDPWDFEEVYTVLHDFARAYPFDPQGEEYLVHITTGTHVAQICLFLLTESRHIPGKLLQTSPPRRDPGNGPGQFAIVDLDLARYDRIASRFRLAMREGLDFLKSGIPTRNVGFNRLIERIERVVIGSKAPILLMGPTGAGKSLLARRMYELRKARHQIEGPFVEVNCATIRGDGAMSALFGHVKGAFTGALQARPGLLRAAHGGVLFLDEIGELGADEQAMLLRALEEKRFLPVGADREELSDFQLLAGTNRDLAVEVGAGRFRELNAAVTRMATLATGGRITVEVVDEELERLRAGWSASGSGEGPAPVGGDALLDELLGAGGSAGLDRFDRVQLADVVRVCRGSRSLSDAGRALYDVSRLRKRMPNDSDRLRKYVARFGLSWDRVATGDRP